MLSDVKFSKNLSFNPEIEIKDPLAHYWIFYVTIILRREICWLKNENKLMSRNFSQENSHEDEILSSNHYTNEINNVLNRNRLFEIKKSFFQENKTASYLTNLLDDYSLEISHDIINGSFSWLKEELGLNNLSCFILALAILDKIDQSSGAIFALCQNDPQKRYPTLALAQILWHNPNQFNELSSNHQLLMNGIIQIESGNQNDSSINWESRISISPIIANSLIFPNKVENELFCGLTNALPTNNLHLQYMNDFAISISRMTSDHTSRLRILPVKSFIGGDYESLLGLISKEIDFKLVKYSGIPLKLLKPKFLQSLIVYCWLKGVNLYIDDLCSQILTQNTELFQELILSSYRTPLTLFLVINSLNQLKSLPNHILYPVIDVPRTTFEERFQTWKESLHIEGPDIENNMINYARAFRFEKSLIIKICQALNMREGNLTSIDVFSACRAEINLEKVESVERVFPNFENESLILPPKHEKEFNEILIAMLGLNKAYHNFDLYKSMKAVGITVLFSGPSGTGKTMAAEILSLKLNLPMYRIDLSQVINKYIGETEKNLAKIFDIAEKSDVILFFDEADAIFGKRTEVKDSHDRYANITVGYLLQRMDRFQGLAILATNRKKDLDNAIMRRIHYLIDFPMPGVNERRKIWEQSFPNSIDKSEIDFEFLAGRFDFSGGNIKSIAFKACLQLLGSTTESEFLFKPKLTMRDILIAIRREYNKLYRSISLEKFGKYSDLIQGLEVC